MNRPQTSLLCILIALGAFSMASTSANAEGIEIVREVLLESGNSVYPDMTLARTADGYVVAGTDHLRAWATRIDFQGVVRWRYPESSAPGSGSDGSESSYEGVVTMPDDTTLLCGFTGGERSTGISGLLTRVDKSGRILARRELKPKQASDSKLAYFRACVNWGEGAAVLGTATRFSGNAPPYKAEDFYWLLAVDGSGNVKWEKLFTNPAGHTPGKQGDRPLALANEDLALSLWYGHAEIVLIDQNAHVKAQRRIDGGGMLIPSIDTDSVVHVLTLQEKGVTLRSLGDHLEDIGAVSGQEDVIRSGGFDAAKAIYLLPDKSMLLFGGQREASVDTAAIVQIDSDLNAKHQAFVFEPRWLSIWIAAAVPTGLSGEFATVRHIQRIPRWPNEQRVGVVLATIRVKQ